MTVVPDHIGRSGCRAKSRGSPRSARTITDISACPTARCGRAGRIAREIVKTAEELGFRNILCPSSYQVGQDTLSFVAGCAPITDRINLLPPIRCGEMQPIMLARTVATLDHMLKGRLTLNIISSDFPGEVADSAFRYQRVARGGARSCARPGRATDRPSGRGLPVQGRDDRSGAALPAERRAAAVFRRLFARRAGTVRRAVRRLPDVAGRPRTCWRSACATSMRAPRRTAARWTTACAST